MAFAAPGSKEFAAEEVVDAGIALGRSRINSDESRLEWNYRCVFLHGFFRPPVGA